MAEKRTESLEFRNLNPMDVSLPTVSPKFGEAVGKAMSDFGRTVQQGVLDYARVAKQQEEEEAIHGITKEYIKASADRSNYYDKNHQGGKIEGQLLSKDYETWSDEWLTTRTKGLSTKSQLKVRRSLESRMGNDYARLVPKQQKYAQVKFLADNEKRNMALSNSLLSMSPDLAYEEVAEMIGDNEKIMEESAGTIFSPDQAAEQTVRFNNQVAVNSLENFVNNKRPELIIDALAPYLESDEAKEFLESKGLSKEELGVEPGPSIIDENVTPQQKSAYLRKAFALMEEQDQINDSILKDRISNFMTAQKTGNISEGQSVSEFMAIEKELLGKNSFGKDRFAPNMAANTILKMTGAHVSRVSQNRIPHTPNGSIAQGLGNIKNIAENYVNELRERYSDDPKMREYLDTPTIKDGLLSQAYRDYNIAASNAMKEREKDSAAYLQKNDKDVAAATEGLFQELGVAGSPDPQKLNEYIKMVRTRADNLGISREAQTIMPSEVLDRIANTAMELRDKFSPTGLQYSAYLEDLKAGVPPEDWMDFKDDLKEKGLKDADFFAVDNFTPQSASYWQKLNNPDIAEGLKQTAKANPELSESKIIAKLQDRGYSLFGATRLFNEDAVFEGPLATTSPIGKALLGPGGEIRNKVMHDRITEMAINSVRWEVGQGKDVDEAFEEATKRIEQAFPTVQGKYGTVIVSGMEGMENPDYAKNSLKDFLDLDHKVSDYTSNFVNHPDIQAQLAQMDLRDPDQQSEYINDNYNIEFANAGEGRMSAYLINKNDKTSIPLEVNDLNGRPVPLEIRLNPDEIQTRMGEIRRLRDLENILDPGRSPDSTKGILKLGPTDQAVIEGENVGERFNSVLESIVEGDFANYDSEWGYDPGKRRYTGRRLGFTERGKTRSQQESKARLLGITDDNKKKLLEIIQDKKHPAYKLTKKILNKGVTPTPAERIKLKSAMLFELGQIAGNIPPEIRERVNKGFEWRLGTDLQMIITPQRNRAPLLLSSNRNQWDEMINHFPKQHRGQVSNELLRTTIEVESEGGRQRFDSSDNLSSGILHIAVHPKAAIGDVIGGSSKEHFQKYFPLYAKDIEGVDKTVLANNDKLSMAVMYSYYNGTIFPKLDKLYPKKKWKKGEKELWANIMYMSGPSKNNFEKQFNERIQLKENRFIKASKRLMGTTKYRPDFSGRSPQSETETFNEPTQTADIEDIWQTVMDKINGRLEKILGED